MSIPAYAYGFKTYGYHTQNLDVVIDEEIPAIDGARLALIDFEHLTQGTAHNAYFMYANDNPGNPGTSRNTNLAAINSAATEIETAAVPMDPAGNAAANLDICAYQLVDGTWEFNVITGNAPNVLTVGAIQGVDAAGGALAIAAGAKVMIFGAVADLSYLRIHLLATTLTTRGEGRIALLHPHMGEPFYLSIDNATAAGYLNYMVMAYINK